MFLSVAPSYGHASRIIACRQYSHGWCSLPGNLQY